MYLPPTQPFSVSQRLVPSILNYSVFQSHQGPPSSSYSYNLPIKLQDLIQTFHGPISFKEWDLPPFFSTDLTHIAIFTFNSEKLISSALIESNERLQCCLLYSKYSFSLILNSSVYHNRLIMFHDSQLLCHHYLLDATANGLFGMTSLFANHPTLTFKYSNVVTLVLRKYAHANRAVDIYTDNGYSLSICMEEKDRIEFLKKFPCTLR